VSVAISSVLRHLSLQTNFPSSKNDQNKRTNRSDHIVEIGFGMDGPDSVMAKQSVSSKFLTVLSVWVGLSGPNVPNVMDVMTDCCALLKFFGSPWFSCSETVGSKDDSPEIRLSCHLLTCAVSHVLSSSRVKSFSNESAKIRYIHDCLMDAKDFRWFIEWVKSEISQVADQGARNSLRTAAGRLGEALT